MNWQERITTDPARCHGRACIKGTRVMVSVVLDNLEVGESPEEIMRGYHVERDDIEGNRGPRRLNAIRGLPTAETDESN